MKNVRPLMSSSNLANRALINIWDFFLDSAFSPLPLAFLNAYEEYCFKTFYGKICPPKQMNSLVCMRNVTIMALKV